MSEKPELPSSGNCPIAQLAQLLAGFLKASFIYPANNTRVVTPCQKLCESLAAQAAPVRIGCDGEGLLVRGERVELSTGNLTWLKDMFDKVLLGGVALGEDVTPEALLAFAKQLRKGFQRGAKEQTFAQLWPDTYVGIELVERRSAGTFAGKDGEAGSPDAGLGPGSRGRTLVEVLESSPEVRRAIESFDAVLEAQNVHETKGRVESTRILETILRQLPAETLGDSDQALATVQRVITAAAGRVQSGQTAPTGDETLVQRIVDRVGRRVFAAKASPSADQGGAAPGDGVATLGERQRGHAGDDLIDDDEQALLAEVAGLPVVGSTAELAAMVDLPSEEIGMLLHLVTEAQDQMAVDRLVPHVKASLEKLDDKAEAVLRAYLEPSFLKFASAQNKKNAWRVIDVLRACGRTDLLIATGVLNPDQIAASFPSNFMLFLESLPADPAASGRMIANACEAIGAARIVAAKGSLLSAGLLEPARVKRVLATPRAECLPLLQVVAASGDAAYRGGVVEFVRELAPGIKEAIPLLVVEPPEELPMAYLEELIDALNFGEISPALTKKALQVLRSYIISTEDRPKVLPNRVAAVKGLGEFGKAAPADLLNELAGGGIFARNSQPRAIRAAAKEALGRIGRRA
jgi:hypothetical protein